MKSKKGIFIALFVILAVVFQLMTPIAVLAQEETPPTTEEPVVEDPTQPEEPVYLPEVMELAPEGTELVVLNSEGEAEPLATEVANVIIGTGVAWWCPEDVQPGGAGCTPAQGSLTDLIATIWDGEYAGDGTIYISNAYSGAGDGSMIFLDNDSAALWYLEDLVVQGGWDTVAGTVNGTTTFTGQTLAINWYYELTINDLDFVNPDMVGLDVHADVAPVTIDNVSVQGSEDTESGISVEGLGNINLNNVQVSGAGTGAVLATYPDADVTVTNSSFTANEAGLAVLTFPMVPGPEAAAQETTDPPETPWGTITLSNVVASNNDWYGAMLMSASDVNISHSVFSNNGALSDGEGGGLGIWMLLPGTITLDYVDASNNNSVGLWVVYLPFIPQMGGGAETAEPFELPETMTMTVVCSTFNDNSQVGFMLDSMDPAVTVDFIDTEATGNGLENILVEGATLNEQTLGSCYTVPAQPVPTLPLQYVRVSGGEAVELDCVHYSGTVLVLPNGDKAIYYCNAAGTANAGSLAVGELPGALGDGLTYLSAMEVGLANGGPVEILPDGKIKIAFQIPQGVDPASLAILYWDPERNDGAGEWVELPADAFYDSLYDPTDGRQVLVGPRVGDGGRFEALVNFTGTFVLVQK